MLPVGAAAPQLPLRREYNPEGLKVSIGRNLFLMGAMAVSCFTIAQIKPEDDFDDTASKISLWLLLSGSALFYRGMLKCP